MAKIKNPLPPLTELAYYDADGEPYYFGELYRQIMADAFPLPSDHAFDVVGKSRRGSRPTQQGLSSPAQHPYRQAFHDCTILWNSLPEACPEPPPLYPITSKESVYGEKLAHGVKCSYYDLFIRCCINYALAHDGDMPEGHCFPCPAECECDDISICFTTQVMNTGDSQNLSVADGNPLCAYTWSIVSGGGHFTGGFSQTTGLSVTYYAPDENPYCLLDVTIELWIEKHYCEDLKISINAVVNHVDHALAQKYCDVEGFCSHKDAFTCPIVYGRRFFCDGVQDTSQFVKCTCSYGGSCVGDGCCCEVADYCAYYFESKCSFGLTCSAVALTPCLDVGDNDPWSVLAGVALNAYADMRTDDMKAAGCCPPQLL